MSTFSVIGATGKTGRRVVRQLRPAHEVREASRGGAVHFDWADPATYAGALDGSDGVFLTVPGQASDGADRVGELLDLAASLGVRRAVLLSARAVEFHAGGASHAVEEVVRRAPVEHVILRPSWFDQNFSEGFLAPDADGVVSAPTGDGPEPFIDLEDVAAVAVAALTNDSVSGTISLSGSEALSFGEAVDRLSRAIGRPARFVAAEPGGYRSAIADGLPDEYVAWRMAMFDAIRTGRDAYLSSGVEDVLGRPARSFSAWVAELTAEPGAVEVRREHIGAPDPAELLQHALRAARPRRLLARRRHVRAGAGGAGTRPGGDRHRRLAHRPRRLCAGHPRPRGLAARRAQ